MEILARGQAIPHPRGGVLPILDAVFGSDLFMKRVPITPQPVEISGARANTGLRDGLGATL